MEETLWEVEHPRRNTHACAGPSCQFCAWLDGHRAKELAHSRIKLDQRWVHDALDWRQKLEPGTHITADDLIEAIGLPDGTPNQVGYLFATWKSAKVITAVGSVASKRRSNHARELTVWEVCHGLRP